MIALKKAQAFGTKAKKKTSDLVYGKTVTVIPSGKDQYGRLIADIIVNEVSLNEELVRVGLAWWYQKYSPNNQTYKQLEDNARQKQIGLWSDENPVPPWDFRKGKGHSNKPSLKTFASYEDSNNNSYENSDSSTSNSYKTNTSQDGDCTYWVNNRSAKRHNSSCRYYKNCNGHCSNDPNEGSACKICGG